ncbi:MAG: DNA helicase, partial [Prevotella sp.]|nr:DNA helicase [Prevotella sp.]
MNSPNNIAAGELFERVEKILRSEGSPVVCKLIYETLELVCQAGLSNSRHGFGNLSSQIDSLCKRRNIPPQDTITIQRARRDSMTGQAPSHEDLLYDCRALCLFISAVMDESIPSALVGRIPPVNKPVGELLHVNYRYIRCIVKSWDADSMRVAVDRNGVEGLLTVVFAGGPDYIDLSYLPALLTEGMQLNLLNCEVKDGVAVPLMVVVEPDYLLDVSMLASCFEDYGHHPLLYTLKRMMPRPNNFHTLLGNYAGAVLDDLVNHPEEMQMAQTLKKHFGDKALEFVTAADFDPVRFKQEAVRQIQNMQGITDDLFHRYDRENAVLEPSFVCEQLGLQGRVDLMTTDMHLLVEQKSGKNINVERHTVGRHGTHIEKHYVQMLLYYGILACNFQVSRRHADLYLLYSRYCLPDGLMEVEPLQKLLREAIRLRNEIVAKEYAMARDGFAPVLPLLTPEVMNTEGMGGFFYDRYLRPQLEEVCSPLHDASPLEQAYFCRMMTFVVKEQLLGKVGVAGAPGSAVADLWNMPLAEKREMGNIYIGLRIVEKHQDPLTGGVEQLKLFVPDQGDDFLPNFRRNDMVYLYAYDDEPDVRKSILLRGTVVELSSESITIGLSNRQHNEQLTETEKVYAVEHAGSEATGASAINGLYTLLSAPAARRALLLSQRPPQKDDTRQLSRSYHPDYDDVLLKAMQAQDYFLLQGPPGTGKTSMTIRFLVEEELSSRVSPLSSCVSPLS